MRRFAPLSRESRHHVPNGHSRLARPCGSSENSQGPSPLQQFPSALGRCLLAGSRSVPSLALGSLPCPESAG